MDTAYLYAPVLQEIYMKQPKGMEQLGTNGKPLVCRLHKSLYGLKQLARNWDHVMDEWLTGFGLLPTSSDPCVYVQASSSRSSYSSSSGSSFAGIIVALYVDDLLIAGRERKAVDEFKNSVSQQFKMKDLGNVSFLLGMEVVRHRNARTLELKQTAYIRQVLQRFGMENCKPVSTPAESGQLQASAASRGGQPNTAAATRGAKGAADGQDTQYMALVGSLLYAATVTRPDIAVSSAGPQPTHAGCSTRALGSRQSCAKVPAGVSGARHHLPWS